MQCCSPIAAIVGPVNGWRPVSASYAMTPSAYRSERGPTDSGSHHCSGDMYGGEPSVALAWVSWMSPLPVASGDSVSSNSPVTSPRGIPVPGWVGGANSLLEIPALAASSSSLAIPKSSSLGKILPAYSMIITFDGLRSRCTIPWSCAFCTISATCSNNATSRSSGIAPRSLSQRASEVPWTSSIAIHASPSSGSTPNA